MSSHALRFAECHSHALDSKVHIGSRCFRAAASRRQAYRRRTTQIRAQEEPEQKKGKGLFSFVTDNPSSQNASVASCRNADGSSTAAAASMQKITCTISGTLASHAVLPPGLHHQHRRYTRTAPRQARSARWGGAPRRRWAGNTPGHIWIFNTRLISGSRCMNSQETD